MNESARSATDEQPPARLAVILLTLCGGGIIVAGSLVVSFAWANGCLRLPSEQPVGCTIGESYLPIFLPVALYLIGATIAVRQGNLRPAAKSFVTILGGLAAVLVLLAVTTGG